MGVTPDAVCCRGVDLTRRSLGGATRACPHHCSPMSMCVRRGRREKSALVVRVRRGTALEYRRVQLYAPMVQ
eukprot:5530486-Prymnesium_polylepis.1